MQRRRSRKTALEHKARVARATPEQIRERTWQRAIKLLAARPRSVAELRERLLNSAYGDKASVETVIARLREYGYLDDERLAFGYASFAVQQKAIGRRRLKRDLAMKKIPSAVADEALDMVFAGVSETELIGRAIEKRLRSRGRPKNRAQAKSFFDYLLRKGFAFELVCEKFEELLQPAEEDIWD